jgi:DNA polymerase I-like protein with 3'-5' exonuclease and polymerase domains
MKLLLCISPDDQPYLMRLRQLLKSTGHVVTFESFELQSELESKAEGYDAIVTSNHLVAACAFGIKFKAPSANGTGATLDDYAGSITRLRRTSKEVLVLNPLSQLVTTDTGMFLTQRYLSKLFDKDRWFKQTAFSYEVVTTPDRYEVALDYLQGSSYIAVDIETGDGHKINCIGFCGFQLHAGVLESKAFVLPLNDEVAIAWMRQLCLLPIPKIFQNGMFDTTQLLTWRTPVSHWYWDTLGLFHSWYSELPRRLDFITSFLLRDVAFWKDDGKTGNLEDYYRYNARDCWATGNAFFAWFAEAPAWALSNYRIKFPEVYPCLQCGLEGIAVDSEAQEQMRKDQEAVLAKELASLQTMLAVPNFNPNSPKQVMALLHMLGSKDMTNADAKAMAKVSARHPLNALLLDKVIAYREASKLLSTYVNAPLYRGRLLYSINPFGTETGRMASKKSHLYFMTGSVFTSYGAQIQNMPPYAKKMLKADPGWVLCEIDKKSSESYCTAALSQDAKLWEVVHTAPDFHRANAELFFGVPAAEVSKDLRQLSKRVNHGANYNMGEGVLVETMGEANVWKAKALLLETYLKRSDPEAKKLLAQLQLCTSLKSVAGFLLGRFTAAYPRIKGQWYGEVVQEVISTKMLTNPSGWTRYCFADPSKDKRALNAYVAHGPQHLSVELLNVGFRQIFEELQSSDSFRLKAQIHDSIFFQYREGREDLVDKAEKMLRTEIVVHGKKLVIPNDATYGKTFWSELK